MNGGFVPSELPRFKNNIEAGFEKAGGGKSWKDSELFSSTRAIIADDVQAALDRVKTQRALYIAELAETHTNVKA